MLVLEKERLKADTAQAVANLRASELNYYVDHIGGIQTIATLLAGFAFTAFLTMDGPSLENLQFRSKSGSFTGVIGTNGSSFTTDAGTTISIDPVFVPWTVDWLNFLEFGFVQTQA